MKRLRITRQLVTSRLSNDIDCSTFKIFYLNSQSLWQHFQVISRDKYIGESNILLFNETHLTDKDDLTNFQINGFYSINMDTATSDSGRRKYNGLAAYLQSNFTCETIHQYRTSRCEYIINGVHTSYEHLIIGLFYVTPNSTKSDIEQMFLSMSSKTSQTDNIIFIGDLNKNCSEDVQFLQVLENITSLTERIQQTTTRGNSQIDICLSNINLLIDIFYVPWSYHFAVSCKTKF